MTASTYTATLFDCPVKDADKREAEEKFCTAIEAELGSEEAVALAYESYMAAFNAYGETPLPPEASNAERTAVARWQHAETVGEAAAFAGWHRWPEESHFEITCQ